MAGLDHELWLDLIEHVKDPRYALKCPEVEDLQVPKQEGDGEGKKKRQRRRKRKERKQKKNHSPDGMQVSEPVEDE